MLDEQGNGQISLNISATQFQKPGIKCHWEERLRHPSVIYNLGWGLSKEQIMGSAVKQLIKLRKRKENPEAKSDSYEDIVCNELSASLSANCPLFLLLTWTIPYDFGISCTSEALGREWAVRARVSLAQLSAPQGKVFTAPSEGCWGLRCQERDAPIGNLKKGALSSAMGAQPDSWGLLKSWQQISSLTSSSRTDTAISGPDSAWIPRRCAHVWNVFLMPFWTNFV